MRMYEAGKRVGKQVGLIGFLIDLIIIVIRHTSKKVKYFHKC